MEEPGALPLGGQPAVVARWLVGLRWVLVFLLAGMLPIGERFFGFDVRWSLAAPALGLVLGVNLLARGRNRTGRASELGVALGVAFDLGAIAAVLAASGGAANPFSALFFVYVALSASLLPPRTTFLLAGLAACLFATLFVLPSSDAMHAEHHVHGGFSAHLYGMWMAFVLSAALVAYALTRVRRALDDRQREIEVLREREHQNARFASLGTLAAGTAHELATPLGTIAVIAGELARAEPSNTQAAAIVAQVARCREIITKMQAGAREAAPAQTPLDAAVAQAVDAWRSAHPDAVVSVRSETNGAVVALPSSDLEAALCALLDNAFHASTDRAPIGVVARGEGTRALVSVEDRGAGVAPHLEGRLGEPFLTTKEPGEGMGLGLFLVRTLVEQVGGHLEVAPVAPCGTRVTLHLACASAHPAASGA